MTASSYDTPVLGTYHAVVLAFSDFLTVAIHTILYERDIYPRESFLSARKYNYPVKQSRHPKVCKWIQDAVAAVEVEMLKCKIASTSLIIHSPTSAPLERYLFSTASFPRIPPSDHLTPFAVAPNSPPISNPPPHTNPTDAQTTDTTEQKLFVPPPRSNLPEQFRATLSRLSTLNSDLAPLPQDCSFTVAIELRDEGGVDPPIGNPQPWVAAEPGLQQERGAAGAESNEGDGKKIGRDVGGVKMTPVRSVEAGAFVMEVWVEEGRGKFEGVDGEKTGARGEAGV